MKSKYLEAFMDMTERFAQTSDATRLKVAACLIKNGNPIAFGVNGTIPGWETNVCEDENGDTKHDVVLHAEIQCLNKLRKINESSVGAILLITHSCCLRCAHEVVDAGITHVYYKHEYRCNEGLKCLKENGVVVYKIEEN